MIENDMATMPLDTVDFTAFLVEAKRSAQPATNMTAIREELPGSMELQYTRGLYTYKNIYCGFERFSGQETVHHDGRAVWGMGYTGGLINSQVVPSFHEHGLPYEEIACLLGVTPAAVRKAKSRVLHRLKEELGELAD